MRENYIYLDLGFYENCNLKCEYCRDKLIMDKTNISFQHIKDEIFRFKEHFNAGVVKLSGYGEITLWNSFDQIINFLSKEFPSIQVITNGTFSQEVANVLCEYDNLNVNFTIDGHLENMNSYRTNGNELIHKKIINNFEKIINTGKNVEINSVLHNRNLENYELFLEYLMQFSDCEHFMVFPFPVKSFERPHINRKEYRENLVNFAEKTENLWEKYHQILPSIEYGKDLKDFIYNGRKNLCYVNWTNFGSGAKDERLICPNYGESLSYGDFINSFDNLDSCMKKETKYFYIQVGKDCKNCFNHYHIINLYLTNRISIDEVQRVPSLHYSNTIEIIKKVKNEFDDLIKNKE